MKKTKVNNKTGKQKSEKRAKAGIVVLMCLVTLCLAGAVGVSAFTDIFKQESEVKAVALVLTQAEEQELEKQLSKLSPLTQVISEDRKLQSRDILSYIRPYAKDGLYASCGYEAAVPSLQADPAMRFKDEEGNYKHYKVTKNRVDSILSLFEMNAEHTVNTRECYYYNGNYYFAPGDEGKEIGNVSADITASKRIQDGRYYIACEIAGKNLYIIAGKNSEKDGQWLIHEISASPMFDQMGIMIKNEAESLFDYEMKTQVIEGKTENGTVYRRYVLRYPVFYGKTAGETEANRFYQSMLSYYTQQAEEDSKQYKRYIKKGGAEEALPLEVNYRAEVTYASGAYIGVSNEISETEAVYESTDEAQTAIPEAVVPSKKTVECYIFDTETGAYVTKDSIIGKDYQLIEELLYRIYCGYDYSSLFSEELTDSAVVPEDTQDLGEAIYASANTVCEQGYMFCYVGENGYREDVIIPFAVDIFEVEIGLDYARHPKNGGAGS